MRRWLLPSVFVVVVGVGACAPPPAVLGPSPTPEITATPDRMTAARQRMVEKQTIFIIHIIAL